MSEKIIKEIIEEVVGDLSIDNLNIKEVDTKSLRKQIQRKFNARKAAKSLGDEGPSKRGEFKSPFAKEKPAVGLPKENFTYQIVFAPLGNLDKAKFVGYAKGADEKEAVESFLVNKRRIPKGSRTFQNSLPFHRAIPVKSAESTVK